MANIAENAIKSATRSQHQPSTDINRDLSLIRCAIHHRLGTVAVGEPSIVIAVSSPHRKEAFVASEEILEEVKRRAQIWKREYYEGEDENDAEWKENT
ncbi:Molybdopterin biosynthesis MoaE [Phlegmacium glaucopus]|nr:Molybdopterin biosynthesis MoaE [Phlegmacium glaucopus]